MFKSKTVYIKKIITCAIFCSLLIFFVGCSNLDNSENGNSAKDSVVVTMPKTSEPDKGFDPIFGWGCAEHVHEPLIQSTLVKTTTDLQIENDLATSYFIADDSKSITFKIRTDAKFSDGSALSAHDVAFTINKEIENIDNATDFSLIESAIATDDETCVVNLTKPDNTVIYLLATVGIVPKNSYNANTYGKNPIGSGRYKLESWERGRSATFVANENYYGEVPNIKRIEVLFVDEEASFSSAKTGEVDVAYASPELSQNEVNGFSKLKVETVDSRGISLPTVDRSADKIKIGSEEYVSGNDVTSDFSVRYAMNLAINKQDLIDKCLYGCAKAANSVCDELPWGSEVMKIECDKQKAITVLEDAGWSLKEDGIRQKDGKICEFNLYYANSDSTRKTLAYAFTENMKDIGIKVNPIGASWDDIYPHQFSDAVLWGWGSNSPSELISIIKTDGTCNFSQFKSIVADALIDEALSKSDLSEMASKLKDAQSYVSPKNASSWIWIANVDHVYFVKDGLNVSDQKVHPHGHGWSLINNIDSWSWQ